MNCMVCSTSRGTIVIYQMLDMTCEVEKMTKDGKQPNSTTHQIHSSIHTSNKMSP